MNIMQDPSKIDSLAPLIEEQFNLYNQSSQAINPIKAWTYGQLAMIKQHMGNQEAADEYINMAEENDPYFSRAMGKPGLALYSPPNEVIHEPCR